MLNYAGDEHQMETHVKPNPEIVLSLSSMLRQGSREVVTMFPPTRVSVCMKTIIKYSVSLGKTGGR